MRIPTCGSNAKYLQSLWRIKLKVTGVLIHGQKKDYHVYVTPPWIKTGFNITGTIFADLISKGHLNDTHELRLQLDGASDNVTLYNIYYWCWQLLYALEHNLPLQRVRVSRLIVGHTHFDVDQMFAIFSMYMFGKRSEGTKRRNVLTPLEFEQAVREAHKTNLRSYNYCGAAYDFKQWQQSMREKNANIETGIKKAYVIELFLDVTDESKRGVIYFRMKPRMGVKYAWTEPLQFYPHRDGVERPMPQFDSKPGLANFKKWLSREEVGGRVIKDYIKFLDSDYVSCTATKRAEVVAFLDSIPQYVSEVPETQIPEFEMPIAKLAKPVEVPDLPLKPAPGKTLSDKTMATLPVVLAFGRTRREVTQIKKALLGNKPKLKGKKKTAKPKVVKVPTKTRKSKTNVRAAVAKKAIVVQRKKPRVSQENNDRVATKKPCATNGHHYASVKGPTVRVKVLAKRFGYKYAQDKYQKTVKDWANNAFEYGKITSSCLTRIRQGRNKGEKVPGWRITFDDGNRYTIENKFVKLAVNPE
jgi:hypothetical protein